MVNARDNIDDLRRDLERALSIIADRADDYTAAKEYYDGTRAEVADTDAVRKVVEQTKRAPLSFAHIPCDVIADKVEFSALVAKGGAAARALETWGDANDLDDEATDWILKACIFGDYYVVTDPVGLEDDGKVLVEEIEEVGMSPLSTVMVYDKKTGRKPQYGLHVWDAGTKEEPATRALLYYDNATVKLYAPGKNAKAEIFVLDIPAGADDDEAYIEHEGGRMLLHHFSIGGKPYGVPVHRKAYGPQDAITKISANNLVNVEAQGLPSRWALMDPSAEIDDDIDDDFGTDGPATAADKKDGRLNATTGRRSRVVPGAIQYLRGVSDTGTYEPSSADPFLANLDFYIRAMGVACGIALFELDPSGEVPSGEARRRAESRANRKAASIKRQAGAFFREIADTVLGLVGLQDEVTVTFAPSETATDKDGLELVGLKIKGGVPVRTALLEAGYTDEQVKAWYPEGAPALSPDLLTVLAEVLAKLGNAVTLGAIDARGIEAMIPEVFQYVAAAAVEGPLPIVTDAAASSVITNAGSDFKAKADAIGILVRAGADPEEAAAAAESGDLTGLTFPNVPVTVRLPEDAAAGLEGDASAPAAP